MTTNVVDTQVLQLSGTKTLFRAHLTKNSRLNSIRSNVQNRLYDFISEESVPKINLRIGHNHLPPSISRSSSLRVLDPFLFPPLALSSYILPRSQHAVKLYKLSVPPLIYKVSFSSNTSSEIVLCLWF